jgi:tetraacyldisaccharide 4'-kinase
LRVKEALRAEPKRLQWPVVSVGSLSAGGAGKTPVVIALALLLKARGWGVDVLSRGYGRSGRAVECVSGDNAARFGDEPVVIAQAAGVPVWVGAERFAAGQAAELQTQGALRTQRDAKKVHLLDDGFQHGQLARALDVVLVTAEDVDDVLLPAGNLREPLSALGRAGVVVVREEELEAVQSRVWALMHEGAQMWVVRRRLRFPAPMKTLGAGLRPVAFCALARPEGFATMLADAGCGVVETVAYRDHHRYTPGDVKRLLLLAKKLQASGFVTTEKDTVKLSAEMRARLETVGPVMVVALEAEFVDAEAVVQAIEAKIA